MKSNRWHPVPFLSRYEVDPDTGCWVYSGQRSRWGYGVIAEGQYRTGDRVRTMAHRYFYEHLVGPIPDGLLICHRCDNRPCVNPDHLFPGTQLDNIRDMDSKGRRNAKGAVGVRNTKCKLTENEVLEIRSANCKQSILAELYGVSPAQISAIIVRRAWPHI